MALSASIDILVNVHYLIADRIGNEGDPAGETERCTPRLDFDRRVMRRFHDAAITSDGGLLAYRELDEVLAPSVL